MKSLIKSPISQAAQTDEFKAQAMNGPIVNHSQYPYSS